MSPITALLSARTVEHPLEGAHELSTAPGLSTPPGLSTAPGLSAPPAFQMTAAPTSRGLHELVEGESATIVRLAHASDAATARRLFDLGFTPGATVTKVRRAPFGGPSVYRVADYEIALRPAQARTITITTHVPAAVRA